MFLNRFTRSALVKSTGRCVSVHNGRFLQQTFYSSLRLNDKRRRRLKNTTQTSSSSAYKNTNTCTRSRTPEDIRPLTCHNFSTRDNLCVFIVTQRPRVGVMKDESGVRRTPRIAARQGDTPPLSPTITPPSAATPRIKLD